jgi:glycine dehydrogenase subunit 2
MTMNHQGRPTQASVPTATAKPDGFLPEEALIFEQGSPGRSGIDLPDVLDVEFRLGVLKPRRTIGLPGLSEPQIVRHFTRLSQRNFGIDSMFYPLGSCTMKHNPRLNEKMARLSGLADIHPLQPFATVQGALHLMQALSDWLLKLTGMDSVALSPGAGAHGEFCGMSAIWAAHHAKGQTKRTRVLVPESAHGTNPATAAALGYTVEPINAGANGRADLAHILAQLDPAKGGDTVAGIMLTNPNTCGLFENDIRRIADAVHKAGAYLYCDGANFNAIVGRVKVADLGVDAMHINLHKTFSTPHGGGGPGSGPVVFSKALSPYAPVPQIECRADGTLALRESASGTASFGRLKEFHGQMGMFVRALTYMFSHGADGLHRASGDAVLNANYILASLKDVLSAPFDGPCMHEALFDDRFLKDTGVTTLDLAKGLIDRGYHPMTMYFPLVVHGALLIEPTETESKETLDGFIAALREIAALAASAEGRTQLQAAPVTTPRRRMDESQAARQPILRWKPLSTDEDSDEQPDAPTIRAAG